MRLFFVAGHAMPSHRPMAAVNGAKVKTGRDLAVRNGIAGICGLPRAMWPASRWTQARLSYHLDRRVKTAGTGDTRIGFDFIEGDVTGGPIDISR